MSLGVEVLNGWQQHPGDVLSIFVSLQRKDTVGVCVMSLGQVLPNIAERILSTIVLLMGWECVLLPVTSL